MSGRCHRCGCVHDPGRNSLCDDRMEVAIWANVYAIMMERALSSRPMIMFAPSDRETVEELMASHMVEHDDRAREYADEAVRLYRGGE